MHCGGAHLWRGQHHHWRQQRPCAGDQGNPDDDHPMGFSKTLGQIIYGGGGPTFLGQKLGSGLDYSQSMADKIDEEVKDLVQHAYNRAKDLALSNINVLRKTEEILFDKETIDGEEFLKVIAECKAIM